MPHSSYPTNKSWCDHFPPNKIKGALQAQEEVGQLREPVLRLISAASALFISDMMNRAQSADSKLITLEDLKLAAQGSEEYTAFLDGVWDDINDIDDSGPYQPKKATTSSKRSSSSNPPKSNKKRIKPDALIQEAMNLEEQCIHLAPLPNAELIVDDEDYD